MSNKKQERLDRMMKLLIAQNGISIHDFAAHLNVAEITVRRDLEQLKMRGNVKLINGVAVYQSSVQSPFSLPEYDLDYECTVFQEKKERIGKLAASLIEPNDVVAIDTGSTAEFLARSIPDSIHLTVLTHSMNVLTRLGTCANHDIICAGGYLYPNTRMFFSPEGISLINHTCVNKAFITAAGISGKLNVTCVAPHEMNAKCALMESSQTKILLLDSSKFSKICPTTFAHLSDFDAIITDTDLSGEWQAYIHELNIELHLA